MGNRFHNPAGYTRCSRHHALMSAHDRAARSPGRRCQRLNLPTSIPTSFAKNRCCSESVKQRFGYAKANYQGVAKNTAWQTIPRTTSNLWLVRRTTVTKIAGTSATHMRGLPRKAPKMACQNAKRWRNMASNRLSLLMRRAFGGFTDLA
jgi:hypothetical protein